MTMMASGRLWQIARCLGARPGILLQMMLAPRATTEEKPLEGTQIRGVRPGGKLWGRRCWRRQPHIRYYSGPPTEPRGG